MTVDKELTFAIITSRAPLASQNLAEDNFTGFDRQLIQANKGRHDHTVLIGSDGSHIVNTVSAIDTPSPLLDSRNRERLEKLLNADSEQISNLILGGTPEKYVLAAESPICKALILIFSGSCFNAFALQAVPPMEYLSRLASTLPPIGAMMLFGAMFGYFPTTLEVAPMQSNWAVDKKAGMVKVNELRAQGHKVEMDPDYMKKSLSIEPFI